MRGVLTGSLTVCLSRRSTESPSTGSREQGTLHTDPLNEGSTKLRLQIYLKEAHREPNNLILQIVRSPRLRRTLQNDPLSGGVLANTLDLTYQGGLPYNQAQPKRAQLEKRGL